MSGGGRDFVKENVVQLPLIDYLAALLATVEMFFLCVA